jgi:hypothetical protein
MNDRDRPAEPSTPSVSGLGKVRPGPGPEVAEDVLNRNDNDRYSTPRRYEDDEDPVMPSGDSSLNTKI